MTKDKRTKVQLQAELAELTYRNKLACKLLLELWRKNQALQEEHKNIRVTAMNTVLHYQQENKRLREAIKTINEFA